MAPRNSKTKIFRQYKQRNWAPSAETAINNNEQILRLYSCIMDPSVVHNEIHNDFEDYKMRKQMAGEEVDNIESLIKDDMDGDPRYVNQEWYQKKAKGLI